MAPNTSKPGRRRIGTPIAVRSKSLRLRPDDLATLELLKGVWQCDASAAVRVALATIGHLVLSGELELELRVCDAYGSLAVESIRIADTVQIAGPGAGARARSI